MMLLDVYRITGDRCYLEYAEKNANALILGQHPSGGWHYFIDFDMSGVQQWYDEVGSKCWGWEEFYHYYGNIQGNIYLLLYAWEKLGNEEYKKAAYRGMDFVVLSQNPPPQAGWSEQYNMDLKPAQGRSYEPPSIAAHSTTGCIHDLMNFYKITGDRRYLKGIPAAIEWLENSYLPEDQKLVSRVTHGLFYELGTNRPLYSHREGTSIENGRYWNDYNPKDSEVDPEKIKKLIASLDSRGAWITEIKYTAD